MNHPRPFGMRHFLTWGLGGFFIGLIFLFFAGSIAVGRGVICVCERSQEKYSEAKNCSSALILLLEDEDRPFVERNSAIWALGQIRSDEAYPVLKSYYTGDIPDREPLNDGLSQYELKKALSYYDGTPNLAAKIWKRIFVNLE